MLFPKGGFGPLSVLVPHAPCADVTRLRAGARRAVPGRLGVRYLLEADMARLRLVSDEGGELWQHTCFELFVLPHGSPGYYEFNFAVSRAWAAYAFSAYRKGGRLPDAPAPNLAVRTTGGSVELEAEIALDGPGARGELAVGLSAVIESSRGELSYWALRHAPGKPDFHHPDSFAARLDALRD